eukprot:TRINITY_DN8825_c0_g1_i6.p2 TRINITY_DN8825_c0_g1~~TRINITY_DN8825_c0_g1_i6.p2  ORF type:complete len:214 (-),score=-13.83 TRINITY_DN8825_c0_g1_i6:375-1016(-)
MKQKTQTLCVISTEIIEKYRIYQILTRASNQIVGFKEKYLIVHNTVQRVGSLSGKIVIKLNYITSILYYQTFKKIITIGKKNYLLKNLSYFYDWLIYFVQESLSPIFSPVCQIHPFVYTRALFRVYFVRCKVFRFVVVQILQHLKCIYFHAIIYNTFYIISMFFMQFYSLYFYYMGYFPCWFLQQQLLDVFMCYTKQQYCQRNVFECMQALQL